MFGYSIERFLQYLDCIIIPAVFATTRMVFLTMLFSIIFGFLISLVLVLYAPTGLRPNPVRYRFLYFICNAIRSFPIIILIVAISPLTKHLIGTTIGQNAAILPMTISCTPLLAVIISNSFLTVDRQIVQAAQSYGATDMQILLRVMFPEAFPSILSGVILTTVLCLTSSTVAGAVGAGGLGAVALNYGYQSFNNLVLYSTVAILFALVQIIEMVGQLIYKQIY